MVEELKITKDDVYKLSEEVNNIIEELKITKDDILSIIEVTDDKELEDLVDLANQYLRAELQRIHETISESVGDVENVISR
jgi:hypothetical protein